MPQTRLDAGVRNSVRTIFGYLGVIVAALLAGAQIGLDVQKLALIAGGLSVGIGFGLQTIANNFVSGLILLWERTIRVGDWVVVGAEQGFVRAINARATEIETFDRGSLIVPNSNLVSGVVKNWVHNDRVGRIIVSVNVAYESDVDKVRDLMIAAAKAQDQVLAIPAPSVLFAEFGDWALKFNLICFVDDIELGRADPKRHQFRHSAPDAGGGPAHRLSGAPAGRRALAVRAEARRPRAEDVRPRGLSAAVRPASQPMIACFRASPQW